MVLNTLTVGAAVTPSVIETAISHYIKRGPLRGKPTAHISYDEGLHLVRQFLDYASNHTVDEVQSFTAQWVPCPRWVKASDILIPEAHLSHAASLLSTQLGPTGLKAVGGSQWWQWRPSQMPLKAEWIEMRADYNERKAKSLPAKRIILYIHGGAYYFGSIDEHRYQLQRHARKLKARLLAPRYRLAPQFPFPCGLQDALASYLHLLTEFDPSSILLMGDSAGAGMVMSTLVTLRDQGVPLPAGAILISPWVDLTHSFPSVSGDGDLDYIPANGFHHRPSVAWPPPNEEEQRTLKTQADLAKSKAEAKSNEAEAVSGTKVQPEHPKYPENRDPAINPPPLSINLDGKNITLIDQIQLYAANNLLSHPLVSPALQPSLGGLPPLLIQVGGGELLRDEQVYTAHKAANPSQYPAPDSILDLHDSDRKQSSKYPPTKVQLQVWEDLCHVPHTLSFTRPAKYMYRAVAQFGNWVFSQSHYNGYPLTDQALSDKKDDDALSIISTSTSGSSSSDEILHSKKARSRAGSRSSNHSGKGRSRSQGDVPSPAARAQSRTTIAGGDWVSTASALASLPATEDKSTLPSVSATAPIPEFENSMVRQLIDRHGTIYSLPPASLIPALNLDPKSIGQIKPGPVRKWLAKKAQWDHKFASTKRKVQTKRLDEMRKGFASFKVADGTIEVPPPTALAGRQFKLDDRRNKDMGKMGEGLRNLEAGGKGKKKSWGLAMWSGWGSKHDETTIEANSGIGAAAVVGAATASVGGSGGHTLAQKADDERKGRGDAKNEEQERSKSVGASLRNPLRRVLSRRSSRASAKGDVDRTKEQVPPVPPVGLAADAEAHTPVTTTDGTANAISTTTPSSDPEHDKSSTATASAAAATVVALATGTVAQAANHDSPSGDTPTSQAEVQQPKEEEALTSAALPKGGKVEGSENTFLAPGNARPNNGVVAYPFKLRGGEAHERSASMMTLESVRSGVVGDVGGGSEDAVAGEDGKEATGGENAEAAAKEGEAAETVSEKAGMEKTGVAKEDDGPGKAVLEGRVISEKQRPKLESFVTANEF
ncbi:hypothetical protein KVT40_003200 [Elsinoe batatas]|uniref:Alpha/beta hydrolase fold-3 domain-containing protein n=1 Tax=Elsinoe batatas TaxID=2601811 RepID=A0A8K0L8B7_9PEZI|nr:hypothetical protein KVT40_003200 [Elsinoe batatas]